MAGIVATEASRILTDSLITGGGRQLALATTAPTRSSAGTEHPTKQPVTFGAPADASSVMTCANTGAVTFPNLTADTWTSINVYNGASERRWFGPLAAPRTTQSGDSVSFAIGACLISLG
jgi:hypothetical protein